MAAAGLIEQRVSARESDDERRLLSVYRDLSDHGQATAMRFIRFLQADEQRWMQPNLLGEIVDGEQESKRQSGPMLFELAD